MAELVYDEVGETILRLDEKDLEALVSRPGMPCSEEAKQLISEALTGRTHSKESKQLMSEIALARVPMSEETKQLISESHIGKTHSEETKQRMSEAQMGNTHSLGRTLSEEHKQVISRTHRGKTISEETKRAISKAHTGKTVSEETRRLLSEANMGKTLSEEHKRALLEANTGRPCSEETKQRISASRKLWWENLPQEEKDEHVRKNSQACVQSPSEPERMVEMYLEEHFPGEWLYNGDGKAGFVIGGKVPDFVNVNGRKAVVEVFGEYWHDWLGTEEEEKIAHYAKYGYECTVIWEWYCYLPGELDKMLNYGLV